MKKLSLRNLQKMIDEKYIHVQKHPDMDLWIYDYSPHAQFDKVWNNETMSCRGLIMDVDKNIIARPFPKFFNLEEYGDQGKSLPLEDFEIFEKLDGSLGILYFDDKGIPCLSTRGSFASRQAIKGTKMLQDKIKESKGALVFDPKYTYLFEIIYPLNRIVVDYGELEDLFLLAVVNTQTGTEKSYSDIITRYGGRLSIVKRYDGIGDYKEFIKQQRENSEGYVIRFKDNLRVKVKFTEYKRLHKLMTGVNARRIWELLQIGASIEDMCQQVPDEFYNWVQKAAQRVKKSYRDIELVVLNSVAETENQGFIGDAKELKKQKVQYITSHFPKKYWSLIIMVIDGRDYRGQIWKMIKPAHEEPFNQQLDTG